MESQQITSASERIRMIREAIGKTQWELAEVLGVKQSFLSAVERGVRKAPASWETVLNKEYGVSKVFFQFGSITKNDRWYHVPSTRTPLRTPQAKKASTSPRKAGKSAAVAIDSKNENRQNNLLKADGIRSTVEAAAVGGEAARRWSQRRLLEIRLQEQGSGVVSEGLTSCFVASNMGHYSDQLLKHLYLITQQQVDRVLDQVIDKELKASEAAAKIKAITAPLDALKEQFYSVESHLVEMVHHVIGYFPNILNEVDLSPIDRGDLGWVGNNETSPETTD